ncbi:MAG: hypothetical protein IKQ61_00670 [Spirochaetales bacterium]|nr:hypothetical protein [Spirochaetales bacterium]
MKETIRRYILFIISLFFSGLGVAFTKHGELGVSPVSSVANVINYKFPSISLGTCLILWNVLLILGQILILRKKFRLIQLLQLPLSVVFGLFTDLGMIIVDKIPINSYFTQLCMIFIGITIRSFGVALAVIANEILNSAEAFVKAISDTIGKPFGNVKIVFDVSCVLIAVVLSLLFFNGTIVGTREGTFIAAFLTGELVKIYTGLLQKPLDKLLRS